jgi:hypothetical protein
MSKKPLPGAKMTKAALIEVANQKGIKVPKGSTKEEIQKLIANTPSGDAAATRSVDGEFPGES